MSTKDRLAPDESDLSDRLRTIIASADTWNPAENAAAIKLGAASSHLLVAPGFLPAMPAVDMRSRFAISWSFWRACQPKCVRRTRSVLCSPTFAQQQEFWHSHDFV
jgi:hypothetical protein